MANLRRPTREVRIWILGMWTVPYPKINISLAWKFNMLLNYWIIPPNPRKIYKIPSLLSPMGKLAKGWNLGEISADPPNSWW